MIQLMSTRLRKSICFYILSVAFMNACLSSTNESYVDKYGNEVNDGRLELTLFAEDPEIMTPIGIAVDRLNRIFVLESHTHLEPSDYEGPDSDRIKILEDSNQDGVLDSIAVYAEGFDKGMNIRFSPEGHLYLVAAEAVWVVYDRDGDGISEDRRKLIEFTEPNSVYAHAGLMGVAFSNDGWMYITRGNVGGSRWKLEGTDGSSIQGYGDGGNIFRARPDGSELQEVATGFWNPFDLSFDDYGRLLATDNDPDSRGPNRLLHIIQGGDYGYQSLYGNSGIHPYLAWDGELPGTLPYAVGLGEAPSGLINASQTSFPQDYHGQMITSIWEESRIVRINLEPKGVSVLGGTETMIQGGQQFRPVSFAADTNGVIYFTDWVIREYPNHGRGRIWKLETKSSAAASTPRQKYATLKPDNGVESLKNIYEISSPGDYQELQVALISEDPFVRNAAISVLSDPVFYSQNTAATQSEDPAIRLGSAIALHRSGNDEAHPVARRLLTDEDLQVRQYALKWIGQKGMAEYRSQIENALTTGQVTEELFKTYLATVRHLQPEFIQAYQSKAQQESKQLKRELPPGFIEDFIRDESRPTELRAVAIKYLKNPGENVEFLVSLLEGESQTKMREEVVRTLALTPNQAVVEPLVSIAQNTEAPNPLRAEAILALQRQPTDVSSQIIPLLGDLNLDIQIEAARYLRTRLSNEGVRNALEDTYSSTDLESLKQQSALALQKSLDIDSVDDPSSMEEWQTALTENGDSERGRRVFYSVQSACSSCHAVKERGGDLGPALTNVGQSKSRDQLIQSILQPSAEISPQWQGWYIDLKEGRRVSGRQINVGYDDIEIYTQSGDVVTFDKEEVEVYGVSEISLMPPGIESQLTVSDLRDLISYLEWIK